MSEKTLKRILVGVAVLVVAYAGVALLQRTTGSGSGGDSALGDLLASLEPDAVEEVRFVRLQDTIRLSRSGEAWSVNGRTADSSRVARFWNDLAEARVTGPIARNPANHARLGVAGDSAVLVVFRTSDGQTRELLVGESGPSFPSSYVRLPDRDPVHVVHADLRGAARRNLESWRDRTVVRIDTARVRIIALRRDGTEQTLTREGGAWRVDGAPADSSAVQDLLGALVRLRSTGFAPDTVELASPDRTLVALGQGGDTLTALSLVETEGSGYRGRARGDDTVYELTSYDIGRLFPEGIEADTTDAGAGDGG